MTRIAIDYTSAVRQTAGIGRYTRGLIGALAVADHSTQYVLFSAGRDSQPRAWPPNFALRELPLSDRQLAVLWQRLRVPVPVEWITGQVDLYHSPDFVLPPVRRARTALTVHDLSFLRHPECSSPPLLEYLLRAVPRSVARADVLLADSENTRQDLVELLGVEEERVFVVYAGVDARFAPRTPDPQRAAVLERYGIRRPFILGLGTLQPRKNFCRLIHAYAQLRDECRVPHQLVIGGGKGWLYEDIFDAVDTLGLHGDVLLSGFVDDADLPTLYRAADAFAFPSLYEGFGIPVLEAMSCGTPVVTSTTSSLPEVAGDAALCVPPDDVGALAHALWRLLDDQELRAVLRERGLAQAGRFTWESAAEQLLRVYRHVLSLEE